MTNSREKFEAWHTQFPEEKSRQLNDVDFAYQCWLAGRESMRDEAAQVCEDTAEDGSDSDGYHTAYSCAPQIKEIQP